MVQGTNFHGTCTEFSSLNSGLGMAFVWYLTELVALIAFTFWERVPVKRKV